MPRSQRPRNPGGKSGQKKTSRRSLTKFANEKYRQTRLVTQVLGDLVLAAGGSYRLGKEQTGVYRPGIDHIDASPTETGALVITVTKKKDDVIDAVQHTRDRQKRKSTMPGKREGSLIVDQPTGPPRDSVEVPPGGNHPDEGSGVE